MPTVFKTSKTMNHFLCESLAAFHKATPFHGIVQRMIKSRTSELTPGIDMVFI